MNRTEVFLRRDQVLARVGFKKTLLYDLISAGEFPAPIKISERVVVWREESVAAWQQAKIEAKRGSQK